jgi:hypothetical protein
MKLAVKPLDVPFFVGDTIWVAQSCGGVNPPPYFQGEILQIILDGSLMSTTVIHQREESHDLVISSAVYDVQPVGVHTGVQRVSIQVGLFAQQEMLFGTEKEVQDYQNQQGQSEVKGKVKL